MKKSFFILFLVPLVLSCTHNGKKAVDGNSASSLIKNEAIDVAINYVNGKFKEPKKTVANDGVITIGENPRVYIIDPTKITVGMIDDDNNDDAIVSIDYYNGQYLLLTEHLILINTDGKLMLNRAVESSMKILGIKDKVITAEIYTKSRNSPLANCALCKEVVKYRFKSGDLIKVE
jgi:hypothetical protein